MPSFERADSISQRKRMINEASQAEDFKKVSELAEKTQVELLHGELRGDDSELTMYDEALEMEKEIKRQARLNELREKLNSNDELEKKIQPNERKDFF